MGRGIYRALDYLANRSRRNWAVTDGSAKKSVLTCQKEKKSEHAKWVY